MIDFIYLGIFWNCVSFLFTLYHIDKYARDNRWCFRKTNLKIFYHYGKFIWIPYVTLFKQEDFEKSFKKYQSSHTQSDSIDYYHRKIT